VGPRAGVRVVLTAWVLSRAIVLLAALVTSLLAGAPALGADPSAPDALAVLGGWDAVWYLDVARDGYAHDVGQVGREYTDLAFFPLLPGVMALGDELGLNPFAVGVVVSSLALLAALAAARALTRARIGPREADRTVWILALAPPALVASMPYTEGLVLALAAGGALAAVRGRWALAGVAAAGAALARPPGLLVALLVALLALAGPTGSRRGPGPGRAARLALAVVPSLVALGAYLAWLQVNRGSWTLPFAAQEAWEGAPLVGFLDGVHNDVTRHWLPLLRGEPSYGLTASVRDLAFGLLYAALLALLWRDEGGLRSPWVLYSLAALLVPFTTFGTASLARYGLMAFPLAWPLARRLRGRHARAWAVAACVLTVLMVAQLEIRSP
jgi:hypothetical protein